MSPPMGAPPSEPPRSSAPSSEGGDGPALGRDPFEDTSSTDPFEDGLAQLVAEPAPGWQRLPLRSVPTPEPPVRLRETRREPEAPPIAKPAVRQPTPLRRVRPPLTPLVAEVDLPADTSWIERLIDPDERKHVAALAHLAESETGYDRFGLSPGAIRNAFPLLYAIYRLYFRVQSEGHDHLPAEGPVVLAANHAGLLPFDAAMIAVDAVLHTDPPRLPRAVVDRWAGSLPWVNVLYARLGQVIGTRENVADLLDSGQLLLVFPEGMPGATKTISERYRLQRFHVGFVEQALIAGAPIVPMVVVGSDDQAPVLFDAAPLSRKIGLPTFPITPTFPWLGPLGLLPYPVRYKLVYGEPFHFHEQFGPNDAEDPKIVRYLASLVRHRVQQLLDRHR